MGDLTGISGHLGDGYFYTVVARTDVDLFGNIHLNFAR